MNLRDTILIPALLLFAATLATSCARAPHAANTARPAAATFRDADGNAQEPLGTTGRAATVLLFISPDCPMSNGYTPEMARLADAYAPRGVAFFAVHSDPRVTPEAARTHARQYDLRFPVILDDTQALAHRVGATITPEAAVIDAGQRVVYRGRIDDLYYGFGKRRERATQKDLRDALDAVLSGDPVEPRIGQPPFGCEIPPPPTNNAS